MSNFLIIFKHKYSVGVSYNMLRHVCVCVKKKSVSNYTMKNLDH